MPRNERPFSEAPPSQAEVRPAAAAPSILPYAAPMFAYVILSSVEGYLPQAENHPSALWYPLAYTVKVVVVGIAAWWYRSAWQDLRPLPRLSHVALAALLGVIVWGLWIGLDGYYPALPFLGRRAAFDPAALAPLPRGLFIGVRLLGLVVLVPLVEELFWRSFLIRWLIDQEFSKVPIGRVTPLSAAASSAFFALVHPEWLPALLTGLLWAFLLWCTKSVSACVLSHATANLVLGSYVIAAGAWKYW
jgi:CAAX prenyl protease-like protein